MTDERNMSDFGEMLQKLFIDMQDGFRDFSHPARVPGTDFYRVMIDNYYYIFYTVAAIWFAMGLIVSITLKNPEYINRFAVLVIITGIVSAFMKM